MHGTLCVSPRTSSRTATVHLHLQDRESPHVIHAIGPHARERAAYHALAAAAEYTTSLGLQNMILVCDDAEITHNLFNEPQRWPMDEGFKTHLHARLIELQQWLVTTPSCPGDHTCDFIHRKRNN